MKSYLPLILLLCISSFAKAQTCNCLDELNFVRQHMEKNHPGFNSIIKDPQQPQYRSFIQRLEQKIAQDKTDKYCIAYLKQYILYLKDHHINIQGNFKPVKEDSLPALEAFLQSPAYLSTERIEQDNASIIKYLQNAQELGIEGIYQTPDGTYTMAVIKNATAIRDYAGVILASRTKLWAKGQVKLELKQVNDSIFDVYTYLRNHALNYDQMQTTKNAFSLPGWVKIFPAAVAANASSMNNDLFSFKIIDSNTAYISIRSFGGQFSAKLDSAYKAIMPELTKRRYLVIDVRDNGGGSDRNYKALMPLIYTDTVIHDIVDLYATPDNIKAYTQMRDLYKSRPETYGKDGYQTWETPLSKMLKAKPYSFTPFGSDKPSTSVYKRVNGYPEKVAIIVNRNCASSCESFLFEARFSKKVITVGENSGGYTGYGNVMQINTPCGNSLTWTTMRYRKQLEFDFTGIPPQYRIPAGESDWVEYARLLLQKKL
ncbi:MAG: S41 family peptidase [Chitinophagaceae bacterium]